MSRSCVPHDGTLKALVDCLEGMAVEFLIEEADVSVGSAYASSTHSFTEDLVGPRGEGQRWRSGGGRKAEVFESGRRIEFYEHVRRIEHAFMQRSAS
jgi:hypothetical protein